ncbi:hypothetical protein T4B_9013 [Trichinella pseudospiralis]|uniref:Uncharacterized protein n=1 Tax=Trichinella pseudospiralis TaxID=6337 RepID=A0A0V1F0X1_TRIPS|nr:hypothetical protein T4A_970 [Trichinella pseudospiralis]KRZ27073.1 hypothetical protein T4B_9013 [Trichinella pseudospiralis]KRZ43146.1 hypothetical protein T4C_1004 [Trichinella pseudospiralis]
MLVRQVKLKPCSGTSSGSLLRATKIPLCCTNLCMSEALQEVSQLTKSDCDG